MIISNVIGGLGNQMFQYAAGRAVSLEYGIPLLLDVSDFSGYRLHHGFELQRIFKCPIEIASDADLRNIFGWQYSPRIRQLLSRPNFEWLRRKGYVVEPHYSYWHRIINVPRDCYLLGYWQSEQYFLKFAAQIRADFTFQLPLGNKNAELANQIDQVNAVSLHIRRADYANNPKTLSVHGLCSLDYYHAAIRYIVERVEQPHFFVFSDDIAWAKSNMNIGFPCQYVGHNQGRESYNDMRLMSLCEHHIIANSSFSWWGAWLNPGAEKIVVAPKRWFANKTDTQDLIPQKWVVL